MVQRSSILKSSICQAGINSIRSLKYGNELERIIVPELGPAFASWMKQVAANVAADWPRRTGKSAMEIIESSRVTYGATLSSIHGSFLVSPNIAANEYGTKVRTPRNAQVICIPVYYGLYPDGRPKRLGPNSWRSLGTFWYRSKTTRQLYLAYKTKADGLKIVYIAVPTAGALKPLSKFQKQWDKAIPALQDVVGEILADAIAQVYNQQFLDALNSIDGGLVMRKLPTVIPKSETRVDKLTPRLD